MGTTSETIVVDDGEEICVLYGSCDGYLSGHGKELVDFLKTRKVVNGWGNSTPKGIMEANGAGCPAAQLVAHFKNQFPVGGYYLSPVVPSRRNADFVYVVTVRSDNAIHLLARSSDTIYYEGPVVTFQEWAQPFESAND